LDLELAPEHAGLRAAVRELAQGVVQPLAAEVDREHRFPHEAINAAAEAGLLGVLVPRQYGGAGLDALAFAICIEELAQACASTAVIVDVHTSVGTEPILLFGDEEQKREWLPRLAKGELLGAFALTEPASGSDAASLKTTARRNGNSYVLNGTKVFITNIGQAGVYVVFARTGPDEKAAGITAFLVPAEAAGVKVGQVFQKMGLHGSPTGELVLEDVRVPAANRLGGEGQGFVVAMRALDSGRIGISGQALGIAQAAVDEARALMRQRGHEQGAWSRTTRLGCAAEGCRSPDRLRCPSSTARTPRCRWRWTRFRSPATRARSQGARSNVTCATPRRCRSTRARTRSSAW